MWPPGSVDTVCHRPPLTLAFDHLTLKLVCESHLRWGTFLPNLSTIIGLWVLELLAMYATDARTNRQTDRWTDKNNAYCLLPHGRRHNNKQQEHSESANSANAKIGSEIRIRINPDTDPDVCYAGGRSTDNDAEAELVVIILAQTAAWCRQVNPRRLTESDSLQHCLKQVSKQTGKLGDVRRKMKYAIIIIYAWREKN